MTTLTVKEQLTAAKTLIADPKHWVKGEIARNDDGERVEPDDAKAVCFCSLGALCRVTNDIHPAVSLLCRHMPERFAGFLTGYNDHHSTTHADVMNLFDKAIESA